MSKGINIANLIISTSTAKALALADILALLDSLGVSSEGNKVTLAWETTADLDIYVQNLDKPAEVTSYEKDWAATLEVDQLGGALDDGVKAHVENIKLPEEKGNYAVYANLHDAEDDEIEVPFTVVTQINGQYRKFVKSWNMALLGDSNRSGDLDRMVKIGVITW